MTLKATVAQPVHYFPWSQKGFSLTLTKVMFFITRPNLKTMISIRIFTFYIINQICIIILYQIRLDFFIFEIKYRLTEVLKQPGGGTPALYAMAIHDQRHANVSKERTLLADAEVAPPHGSVPITWLVNVFHQEMNCNKNARFEVVSILNLAAAWQNQHNDLCTQRRLRLSWASTQSDQGLFCPPEATVGPRLPTEHTSNTLIRQRMQRLVWVFAGRKCHFVGLVMRRFKMLLPRVWIWSTYTFHHISFYISHK